MEEELTIDKIKGKTIKGVVALTGRTFILQAVALVATFFLTVFLSPEEYGMFFLVSAIINFFAYFSDIGLAAALIQKKEALTPEELKTTFTIQQILVITLIAIILMLSPVIKNWYNLSDDAAYLIYALAVSLFLSSLKTIPSVILERKLDFNKLIIPQIIETILFYSVVVYMAWKGFGIQSFTVAVLVRGFSGLFIMYYLQPWRMGFDLSGQSLKKLLKFGLPYQTNTFLAVFKDDGITAILGSILGPLGVGYLAWAQKWANAPLRFFMDQVIKVTFPAYSRLQNEPQELSKALTRSIFFICLFVFPTLLGLIIIAPALTQIIPKYEKWQPALLALSLISTNTFFAAITTPLTNFLNAIGKIKITFRLMIMWTVLTWILVPALSIKYGVNGAAAGYAFVGLSSLIAIYIVHKYIKIDFWTALGKPIIAAAFLGITIYLLQIQLPRSVTSLIFTIILGILVYAGSIFFLVGQSILNDFKKIVQNLK